MADEVGAFAEGLNPLSIAAEASKVSKRAPVDVAAERIAVITLGETAYLPDPIWARLSGVRGAFGIARILPLCEIINRIILKVPLGMRAIRAKQSLNKTLRPACYQ